MFKTYTHTQPDARAREGMIESRRIKIVVPLKKCSLEFWKLSHAEICTLLYKKYGRLIAKIIHPVI
jgi:hypothetical protein